MEKRWGMAPGQDNERSFSNGDALVIDKAARCWLTAPSGVWFERLCVMALAGQGDPRWIVQDLGEEGKNVRNWHWSERDISSWAYKRVSRAVQDAWQPLDSPMTYQVTPTVTGECTLYNRKGIVKPVYDLHVTANWEARRAEPSKIVAKGSFSFELYDAEPEVTVLFDAQAPQDEHCKSFVLGKGREKLVEAMRDFVAEVTHDGAAAERESTVTAAPSKTLSISSPVAGDTTAYHDSMTRFELQEIFMAPPQVVFDALTNVEMIRRVTQADAVFERPEDGGSFSMLRGQITGRNIQWEAPHLLVQEWRMADWLPEDHFSIVRIQLAAHSGNETKLTLVQERVPDNVFERTRTGWSQQIFGRMRVMLNLGGAPVNNP